MEFCSTCKYLLFCLVFKFNWFNFIKGILWFFSELKVIIRRFSSGSTSRQICSFTFYFHRKYFIKSKFDYNSNFQKDFTTDSFCKATCCNDLHWFPKTICIKCQFFLLFSSWLRKLYIINVIFTLIFYIWKGSDRSVIKRKIDCWVQNQPRNEFTSWIMFFSFFMDINKINNWAKMWFFSSLYRCLFLHYTTLAPDHSKVLLQFIFNIFQDRSRSIL